MALWLGSLQLMLDKGQESDWFGAVWIRCAFFISVAAFLAFVVRELRCRDPIVQLHVLRNRNFLSARSSPPSSASASTASPRCSRSFSRPCWDIRLDSGLAVSPRGLGSMLAHGGRRSIAARFDGRVMLASGLAIFASPRSCSAT